MGTDGVKILDINEIAEVLADQIEGNLFQTDVFVPSVFFCVKVAVHVTVGANVVGKPIFALPSECTLDRSLGIGEEESLVEYMMRGDPNIVNALKALDASNKKTEKGVTVSDGNSFFHITKEEFLRNLPRKILNVPNPTFRVSIIGRKRIKFDV